MITRSRSRIMKEMKKEKETTRYLPHDVIIQILLRLPMLCLLRFKCVCKLWFSTITDRNFANSYFEITSQTHNPTILFATGNRASKILSINYESSLKYYNEIPKPNFMQTNLQIKIYMMSSCRGFIYLHLQTFICIWNPCTGIQRQIPLSPHELNRLSYFYLYGFGYDQLRDDYLVISVSHNYSYHPSDVYSRFELFSLRDNTWKEIESTNSNLNYNYNTPSRRFPSPKIGLLFNGAIHWVAFDEDKTTEVVIAFDFAERKLVQIPFPDDFFGNDESDKEIEHNDFNVWKFGEFLSLWGAVEFDQVEIWVLKEYKDHSSWIKTLVLSIDSAPRPFFFPICCTKSGAFVGQQHGYYGLQKYNNQGQLLECESYRKIMSKMSMYTELYTELYTESLLSLPGDNVQDNDEEDDTNKKYKEIAQSHSRKRKR